MGDACDGNTYDFSVKGSQRRVFLDLAKHAVGDSMNPFETFTEGQDCIKICFRCDIASSFKP